MPTSGARRLRSTSTANAFIGEIYRTRQRLALWGTGVNMMRLMHHENAARVLPVPVGARIRVDSPRAIAPTTRRVEGLWEPERRPQTSVVPQVGKSP
jgi:hypothetical protein